MSKISENKKFYIVMVIAFLIMLLFGKLPPFGEMTPYGMQFLGIFLGCIFGWLVGVIIPVSLLGIVMAGVMMSDQTVDSMMSALQSTSMVLQVFWAFIFVYGLKKCGVLNFLADKIMALRICSKSPWTLAVSLWICTMICAGITTIPFASAILIFSIFYGVAEKVGAKKASPYTSFVICGIAMTAALSTGMVPYAGNIILTQSLMTTVVPDATSNVPLICLVNFCVTLAAVIFLALLLKILMITNVIKVEFSLKGRDDLFENRAVFDTRIKWGFFYVIVLFVFMLLPLVLPEGTALASFFSRFGNLGMFVTVAFLMMITTVNGEKLLDFNGAVRDGAIAWDVYFMMGAALVISDQLVKDEAGLAATLENVAGGIVGGINLYVLCLIIIIFGMLLTNCITNSVAMQLVIPILAIFVAQTGTNPSIIVGLSGIILVFGLILPSGSPLGAFVHGNVEWVDPKLCYVYAILAAVCVSLSIAAVGVPLSLALS